MPPCGKLCARPKPQTFDLIAGTDLIGDINLTGGTDLVEATDMIGAENLISTEGLPRFSSRTLRALLSVLCG